ncbi:MAG TPA: histidine phosphatase family protein, partial [Armatimonadota bacterium]|nr:histidine phosphatase family protein [Armatimonadota bacterium]
PVDEMARRFPRVNTTYHSVHRPAYPEDDAALRARTAATVAQLLRQHPGNLLLIGHGATLYGIGHALLAPAVPLHTPLCCVIQLYEHDGRWHVAADGRDVSHLSQRESEIRLA